MSENIAGITIPDSTLVREATRFIRETETDLLFHHSRRVFLFGALQGKRLQLQPDLELLYIGAMFHDVGLSDAHGTSVHRFEVDGANVARAFLLDHGASATDADTVWTAIALHTTPEVPTLMRPEIALVTAGVELDVLGIGYHQLDKADRDAVTAAHPRPDFKFQILGAFADGNINRPRTTFGNVNADVLQHFDPNFQRDDFVSIILNSAWAN